MSDPSTAPATDETADLIASDKVEGTAVFGHDGERLGTIKNFMVNKRSGQVEYAVMGFGGFLGMNEGLYPLPWRLLRYDTGLGGYVVGLSRSQIEAAPRAEDESGWTDPAYAQELGTFYGLSGGL